MGQRREERRSVEDTQQLQQRDSSEKFVPIILVDESDRKIEIEMTGPSICCPTVLPTLRIGVPLFQVAINRRPARGAFVLLKCTATPELLNSTAGHEVTV